LLADHRRALKVYCPKSASRKISSKTGKLMASEVDLYDLIEPQCRVLWKANGALYRTTTVERPRILTPITFCSEIDLFDDLVDVVTRSGTFRMLIAGASDPLGRDTLSIGSWGTAKGPPDGANAAASSFLD